MITKILDHTLKFFPSSLEQGPYEIVADGIVADGTNTNLSETYLVGQYINIQHSYLNDGTYKITAVEANKLTLDATLLPEKTEDDMYIWGLRLPRGLLDLVSDIEAYVSGQVTKGGLKSERQGRRAVTYAGDSSWQSVFSSQLSEYSNVYDDRGTYRSRYNIRTKGCC